MRSPVTMPSRSQVATSRCVASNTSARSMLIDVEEPAVVDLLTGDAPIGDAVGLIAEQHVEQVEAARVSRGAIDQIDVVVDESTHGARALEQRGQALPADVAMTLARGQPFG